MKNFGGDKMYFDGNMYKSTIPRDRKTAISTRKFKLTVDKID